MATREESYANPHTMVSGAQPASMQGVPWVKRPGLEADHSLPSSAEVKNTWSYTTHTPHVFMTTLLLLYFYVYESDDFL
jgi:hypothetical protein